MVEAGSTTRNFNDPCAPSNDVDFSITQGCTFTKAAVPEATASNTPEVTASADSELIVLAPPAEEDEVSASADSELIVLAPPAEEDETAVTRSFYSCYSANNSSSDGITINSNGIGNPTAPPDTNRLVLMYDYELHTSTPFAEDMLSSFENSITQDLARQFGLINCDGGEPERRFLRRTLKQVNVVALDSAPSDESLADTYVCEMPFDDFDASSSCTPIRGYMTAYVPYDTATSTEAQLLTLIENGMQSDLYTNDDVIKASYVGARDKNVPQDFQDTQADNTVSDNGINDNSGIVDSSVITDNRSDANGNANGLVNTGNSDVNAKVNPMAGRPNLNGAKASETGDPESFDSPILVIGISIVFLACVLAVCLVVYVRRKRRSKFFSHGPAGVGKNDPKLLASQATPAEVPRDPDDVHLLPFSDKLDMRSVCPENEASTDGESENYSYDDNYDQKNKKSNDGASTYNSLHDDGDERTEMVHTLPNETIDHDNVTVNGPPQNNVSSRASGMGTKMSAGSALAAMGVASTLAAQSFTPSPPPSDETRSSSSATPVSTAMDPHARRSQLNSKTTQGARSVASSVNSHVGTVKEEEEYSLSDASLNVSTLGEERSTAPWDEETALDSWSASSSDNSGSWAHEMEV